jgi:hypothetical protein
MNTGTDRYVFNRRWFTDSVDRPFPDDLWEIFIKDMEGCARGWMHRAEQMLQQEAEANKGEQ